MLNDQLIQQKYEKYRLSQNKLNQNSFISTDRESMVDVMSVCVCCAKSIAIQTVYILIMFSMCKVLVSSDSRHRQRQLSSPKQNAKRK